MEKGNSQSPLVIGILWIQELLVTGDAYIHSRRQKKIKQTTYGHDRCLRLVAVFLFLRKWLSLALFYHRIPPESYTVPRPIKGTPGVTFQVKNPFLQAVDRTHEHLMKFMQLLYFLPNRKEKNNKYFIGPALVGFSHLHFFF